MKQHLNTLFITTQGAYLRKRGETVVVRLDGKDVLRLPFNNIGSIVCFGRVGASPFLLGACAERGITVTLMSKTGRFLAAVVGYSQGNVLLRRRQYRVADDPLGAAEIARYVVLGKLSNYRAVLRRAARESSGLQRKSLSTAAQALDAATRNLDRAQGVDALRGIEGASTARYFSVFNSLITANKDDFTFSGRHRRPPTDPVNALLSFLYTLLTHDARSACEGAGLDAAVGFLHRDRPGRPSLALDLIEELRPVLADRLVLSLINRRQVKRTDFSKDATGGVRMNEKIRKTVIATYQKRKQETIRHPFLGERITLGLLVHIQARLLAGFLRGDLDAYPAFVWK